MGPIEVAVANYGPLTCSNDERHTPAERVHVIRQTLAVAFLPITENVSEEMGRGS